MDKQKQAQLEELENEYNKIRYTIKYKDIILCNDEAGYTRLTFLVNNNFVIEDDYFFTWFINDIDSVKLYKEDLKAIANIINKQIKDYTSKCNEILNT